MASGAFDIRHFRPRLLLLDDEGHGAGFFYIAMFNAAWEWLPSLGRPVDGKPGAIIGEFELRVVRPG